MTKKEPILITRRIGLIFLGGFMGFMIAPTTLAEVGAIGGGFAGLIVGEIWSSRK